MYLGHSERGEKAMGLQYFAQPARNLMTCHFDFFRIGTNVVEAAQGQE